jgi:phosphomannomutase
MNTNWSALQNGSDIRGIAGEGVAGETVNLTPDIAQTIAIAFVKWLSDKTGTQPEYLKIAVGRDSRISGPALMTAFIEGLSKCGVTAIDCGIASTPAMYMSTVLEGMKYDGSAMLTASHLPFNRNGIKFFTNEGGLDKPDIKAILDTASTLSETPAKAGNTESFDLISAYSDFLVEKIRKGVNHPSAYNTPLAGFRIVVDAGNGAGGFFADKVLKPLGADTTGSQFLNPDGRFPNHVPNPEDETAMEFIQKAVVANKADLGIIFDTDVDRAAAVDHLGNNINRNTLIALIGSIVLEEHPGSTIVTDSITSDGLADFIEKDLKGKHHRFKRGYKNVINEAIRLNNEGQESWLAIETSGHAALKENFFLDDGAYLITKILIKAAQMRMDGGKTVLDITSKLRQPAESKEFRIKILDPDFKAVGNQVIKDLNDFVDLVMNWGWKPVPNNYEGIRVKVDSSAGDGWFLLRLSLHDPVIPLNIESNKAGGVKQISTVLDKFFEQYENLDFTAISKFVQ